MQNFLYRPNIPPEGYRNRVTSLAMRLLCFFDLGFLLAGQGYR